VPLKLALFLRPHCLVEIGSFPRAVGAEAKHEPAILIEMRTGLSAAGVNSRCQSGPMIRAPSSSTTIEIAALGTDSQVPVLGSCVEARAGWLRRARSNAFLMVMRASIFRARCVAPIPNGRGRARPRNDAPCRAPAARQIVAFSGRGQCREAETCKGDADVLSRCVLAGHSSRWTPATSQ